MFKTNLAGINFADKSLRFKLSQIPIRRSASHRLVLVHFDPEYFIARENEFVRQARAIVKDVPFSDRTQLLTGSRASCLPEIGQKVVWWPPENSFINRAKHDVYTLLGGYFQHCLKTATLHIARAVANSKKAAEFSIHLPLPAIFDLPNGWEHGDDDGCPQPPQINYYLPGFAQRLSALPIETRFLFATQGVLMQATALTKGLGSQIRLNIIFWTSADDFVESLIIK